MCSLNYVLFQVIHDILSKHSFNTDAAAAELSRSYGKNLSGAQGYNQWREVYDKRQAKPDVSNVIRYQQQQINSSYQQHMKRKAVDDILPKKKKGEYIHSCTCTVTKKNKALVIKNN